MAWKLPVLKAGEKNQASWFWFSSFQLHSLSLSLSKKPMQNPFYSIPILCQDCFLLSIIAHRGFWSCFCDFLLFAWVLQEKFLIVWGEHDEVFNINLAYELQKWFTGPLSFLLLLNCRSQFFLEKKSIQWWRDSPQFFYTPNLSPWSWYPCESFRV